MRLIEHVLDGAVPLHAHDPTSHFVPVILNWPEAMGADARARSGHHERAGRRGDVWKESSGR
jgi:hypothetical protein